ncbi:Fur-regulated basic protein FbpA [Metabacillus sp. HB246100]|uniref:Fur-regulated basic protein FbpA n=1 Tax=Bacillus weihaiensis TaxID=1547283 RepID=UPI0023539A50|nr:Fur-regulated basic protein FbpA [Bacillus weihaiensis]
MDEGLNQTLSYRKEQVIQKLLNLHHYKTTDDRQLYELTLSELESEYKALFPSYSHLK